MTESMFATQKNCPRCGCLMDPVALKTNERIGWFCSGCTGLLPNEGVDAITHAEDFK